MIWVVEYYFLFFCTNLHSGGAVVAACGWMFHGRKSKLTDMQLLIGS